VLAGPTRSTSEYRAPAPVGAIAHDANVHENFPGMRDDRGAIRVPEQQTIAPAIARIRDDAGSDCSFSSLNSIV
jgi:hypothetical protein